jgi:hypothetical protein
VASLKQKHSHDNDYYSVQITHGSYDFTLLKVCKQIYSESRHLVIDLNVFVGSWMSMEDCFNRIQAPIEIYAEMPWDRLFGVDDDKLPDLRYIHIERFEMLRSLKKFKQVRRLTILSEHDGGNPVPKSLVVDMTKKVTEELGDFVYVDFFEEVIKSWMHWR